MILAAAGGATDRRVSRLEPSCVVILAAGTGSRFGGSKQLAEVRSDGAAIMDVLVERAATAGFARAVIVVAPGSEAQVRGHLSALGEAPIPRELVVQELPRGRSRPLGTAHAVLAARASVARSFVVVNGDDLYPARGFVLLAEHFRTAPEDQHAMVAFRVDRTLVGDRPVSRALVEADAQAALVAIREGTVVTEPDGLQFEVGNERRPLRDDACVSMNMWGFRASIFDALERAVAEFCSEARSGEVFLPDVVAAQVAAGATVRVLVSDERCLGVTHEADLAAVRNALA